jgi:hypothetical protein
LPKIGVFGREECAKPLWKGLLAPELPKIVQKPPFLAFFSFTTR